MKAGNVCLLRSLTELSHLQFIFRTDEEFPEKRSFTL